MEREDHWVIPLNGRQATRCCVDHAFTLDFWEKGNEFTLRIEAPFIFTDNGKKYSLSAEHDPTLLGPALSIFRKIVESATAWKNGRLEVVFTDRSTLSVEPDPNYEAWQISGPAGFLVVCIPAGELAVWEPR